MGGAGEPQANQTRFLLCRTLRPRGDWTTKQPDSLGWNTSSPKHRSVTSSKSMNLSEPQSSHREFSPGLRGLSRGRMCTARRKCPARVECLKNVSCHRHGYPPRVHCASRTHSHPLPAASLEELTGRCRSQSRRWSCPGPLLQQGTSEPKPQEKTWQLKAGRTGLLCGFVDSKAQALRGPGRTHREGKDLEEIVEASLLPELENNVLNSQKEDTDGSWWWSPEKVVLSLPEATVSSEGTLV
ncbi:uncharacterized protein LOC117998748 [Mirounga leonina]|uniref:uncharacterized protein LOC117998748 n=1 Tax=Mirounga leonina TaxID=9715 RepID=UPI00156C4971|nr:uncharacterized protein LOC117998748 [Mirounga leonina]